MRVVPALDEIEDGEACLGVGPEGVAVDELALERGKEALTHRIVVAIAGRAHGRPDSHFFASFPESDRGVLASLIGVVDDISGSPLLKSHLESIEHELGLEVSVHGPSDDSTAPRIEHDSQIEEAGPRRDVGDVRDPEPVWSRSCEITVHEVRGRSS
jgi:hypothetical protein